MDVTVHIKKQYLRNKFWLVRSDVSEFANNINQLILMYYN